MSSVPLEAHLPDGAAVRLAWWRRVPGLVSGALVLVAALAAAQLGAVPVRAVDWLAWAGDPAGAGSGPAWVLWNLRLPRVLFALAVGAALGLAGALAQGLFRNPLADPGLLGVSSGAACAAALVIVVFAGMGQTLPPSWRPWVLPAASFGGALGVCALLETIARRLAPGSVAMLVLAGLAVNALAMAVVGLCTYLASDEQLRSLSFWSLGALSAARWPLVGVLGGLLALGLLAARRLAGALNALALGEATAGHVGVDVGRLRTATVIVVALLCGFAVAWCGTIGFVGLVAPHLVRLAVGADQRRVLALSMPAGALLLLAADTAARTVALPAEVPVGIFTALLGAPALFGLLVRERARIA